MATPGKKAEDTRGSGDVQRGAQDAPNPGEILHADAERPNAPKSRSAALDAVNSKPEATPAPVPPEQAKPQKPYNPFKFGSEEFHPIQTALTARIAYLGIKGELIADKASIVNKLAKAGPMGEQLAQRLVTMEAQGWSVGRLTMNDPYLKTAFPNPVKRAAMYPMVAGYNTLYHENTLMKRVTYNSTSHLVNQALTSFGNASPVSRVVGNVAHELGHWDRVPLPEVSQLKGMSIEDQRVFARRLLQTETNAILPQLQVSQQMRVYHPDIEIYREALKKGNLGSVLRNRWINYGNIYSTFEHVTAREADAFVKELLDTNYKGVVKPNGQIAPYDLNSIRGKFFGATKYDAEILAKIDAPGRGVQVAEGSMARFLTETKAGSALRRGGVAAGSIGIALIGTDIAAGFYESTEKGMGKVGRTMMTWGAYEVGSVGGAALGAPLARAAMRTKYGYMALPVAAILGGVTTASVVDLKYGASLENTIQKSLGTKPEDELRKTLMGK